MRKTIAALIIGLVASGLFAQNILFADREGMVLTYARTESKGRIDCYIVTTIKNITNTVDGMIITYGTTILEANRRTIKKPEEIKQMVVKNGIVLMDGMQLLGPLGDLSIQEVSGQPIELPANLQAGQRLRNAEMTLKMSYGIISFSADTRITGMCNAVENLEVQAGSFTCQKISMNITTSIFSGRRVNERTLVSWYAPGIGAVKTEMYDDKNKLVFRVELVELNGN